MHQSLDHEIPTNADAPTGQAFRTVLARDLKLPEQHAVITATLSALSTVTRLHALHERGSPTTATHDAWWCIVGHTHALTAK